jgi:hypothetical protein
MDGQQLFRDWKAERDAVHIVAPTPISMDQDVATLRRTRGTVQKTTVFRPLTATTRRGPLR